jgi:hypothetical protein
MQEAVRSPDSVPRIERPVSAECPPGIAMTGRCQTGARGGLDARPRFGRSRVAIEARNQGHPRSRSRTFLQFHSWNSLTLHCQGTVLFGRSALIGESAFRAAAARGRRTIGWPQLEAGYGCVIRADRYRRRSPFASAQDIPRTVHLEPGPGQLGHLEPCHSHPRATRSTYRRTLSRQIDALTMNAQVRAALIPLFSSSSSRTAPHPTARPPDQAQRSAGSSSTTQRRRPRAAQRLSYDPGLPSEIEAGY